MTKSRITILVILLSATILLLWISTSPWSVQPLAASEFEEKLKVGQEAPDFTTKDIEGKDVTLSAYHGNKVILLNFWGIRCGACIEEMPYLEKMHNKYKDRVAFLGVDTDGVNGDIIKGALKDLDLKISFTLLTDLDFSITDTYTNFLVPLTIVIDLKGFIRYVHTGFEKGVEKEYEEALDKVLREAL